MSKILKKDTAGDYFINDMGVTVPGNGQLTIDPNQYYLLQASADVITALTNTDLIYNDGSNDLELNDAIEHIKNYFHSMKPEVTAVLNVHCLMAGILNLEK